MKQIGESISKSTKPLLGRLTTVTTLGCLLALIFLVAASPQPQKSGKALPFKVTGIFTSVPDDETLATGTFLVVGNASHLGNIVFPGVFTTVNVTASGLVTVHIHGTYTAANGDTIEVDCPDWVTQYDAAGNPVTSTGLVKIIGGTGRFANASGSYVGNIYPGDTFILVGEGTISY